MPPLKLLQDQNKLLFTAIFVSMFGGLILASFEGYFVYIIGYSILLTIIGISLILYFVVSYKQMMIEPRNWQKEMEQELAVDLEGKRPISTHQFNRITFTDNRR